MKISDTFLSPDSLKNPLMPCFATKAKVIDGAVVDPLFFHKAISVELLLTHLAT